VTGGLDGAAGAGLVAGLDGGAGVALCVGGAAADGVPVPEAAGGAAPSGRPERITAVTTAAASNSTAAASAISRRLFPARIDHMLHHGTTGPSKGRAERPAGNPVLPPQHLNAPTGRGRLRSRMLVGADAGFCANIEAGKP